MKKSYTVVFACLVAACGGPLDHPGAMGDSNVGATTLHGPETPETDSGGTAGQDQVVGFGVNPGTGGGQVTEPDAASPTPVPDAGVDSQAAPEAGDEKKEIVPVEASVDAGQPVIEAAAPDTEDSCPQKHCCMIKDEPSCPGKTMVRCEAGFKPSSAVWKDCVGACCTPHWMPGTACFANDRICVL